MCNACIDKYCTWKMQKFYQSQDVTFFPGEIIVQKSRCQRRTYKTKREILYQNFRPKLQTKIILYESVDLALYHFYDLCRPINDNYKNESLTNLLIKNGREPNQLIHTKILDENVSL